MKILYVAGAIALLFVTNCSLAQTAIASNSTFHQGGEFKVGSAVWNVFDNANYYALHIAYIHKPLVNYYELRPTTLLMTADENHYYLAMGVAKDLYQQGEISVRFAFHVGLINKPEELSHHIEFYSSLSGLYQLSETMSIEAEVGHISNAGLGDRNPGSESFVLSLHYHF